MADNTADSIIAALIKFAWPIFGILALVSGTILFWPSAVELFQLHSLPKWILDYVGLAFLVSAAILVCLIGNKVYRTIKWRLDVADYERDILQTLTSLSWTEKAILREFILTGSDVLNLPYQHPSVLALRNKSIIGLATTSAVVYGMEMEFPHQLPPRIKELIQPEMIELKKAYHLYDTDRAQFEAFRPDFRQPRGYY